MASGNKSKLKILYLLKFLQEETDAEHGLTMSQLIERLNAYGISAERKSVYADIKALREFDIDIQKYERNPIEYAIKRRDFKLSELMLMVDAIQSCRAITEHQANMLTLKIKQLANNHEQVLLERNIHVVGRIKTKSDSVLPTIDAIHEAIRKHRAIEFSYRKIGTDGKPHATHEGKKREATPLEISYDDGFYYLSAWDAQRDAITEFRIDRMAGVNVLDNTPAAQNDAIAHFKQDDSKPAMFGRFIGEEVTVTLGVDQQKVEIITDRFGKAATFLKPCDGEARASVKICKSQQFFGWVAGMGKAVRIVAPQSLVDEYRSYLQYLLED